MWNQAGVAHSADQRDAPRFARSALPSPTPLQFGGAGRGDIEEVPEGLRITIHPGKTDQEGRGSVIAIVRGEVACPVEAVRAWLQAAQISEGAIFRPVRRGGHVQAQRLTDRSVANIVKAHAERAGLDPTLYSGHSLRAGFLTSAAKRGASLFKMMATSRHRSTDTPTAYVRDQELFSDHAGNGLL